jgi:hypothetical protein
MFSEEKVVEGKNRIEAVTLNVLEQSPDSSHWISIVLLGVAIVLAAAVAFYFTYRKQLNCVCDDPELLFKELCRAHGLTFGQKAVLLKLIKARRLNNPNLVLIDSSLWVLDPTRDAELCTPKVRNRLIHVQRLLFSSEVA